MTKKKRNPAFVLKSVDIDYGKNRVLSKISIDFYENRISTLIGPSGCGKSTLLRCLNRMNDFYPEFKLQGQVLFYGKDIYASNMDPVNIRLQVGMVFQQPNPFPKSIFENIALAPRLNGYRHDLQELVEHSLRQAYLWEEVHNKLQENALTLSGGQQQRLCIARSIAMQPRVLLMDEPTASLDPISTRKVEELITKLKEKYTIIIVTHNMQQAARVGDQTIFLYQGKIIESRKTLNIFTRPKNPLTEDYISGRFG